MSFLGHKIKKLEKLFGRSKKPCPCLAEIQTSVILPAGAYGPVSDFYGTVAVSEVPQSLPKPSPAAGVCSLCGRRWSNSVRVISPPVVSAEDAPASVFVKNMPDAKVNKI
jgi:hypothetical protein